MIHIVFGGQIGDQKFQSWTKQDHNTKYIKTFNGMKGGSFGDYARYCIESAKKLVKKNDFGDVIEVSMQNDTMLVHFPEEFIVEDADQVVSKARGYYNLARDLGLNCKLMEYKSHEAVVGISSCID